MVSLACLFLALLFTRLVIWANDIHSWTKDSKGDTSWTAIITVGGLAWVVGTIMALHALGWLPSVVW